ncbi:MAG: hypothetical protein ABH823_01150 [bacterium]
MTSVKSVNRVFVGLAADFSRNVSVPVRNAARTHGVTAFILSRTVIDCFPDITEIELTQDISLPYQAAGLQKKEAAAVIACAAEISAPVILAGDYFYSPNEDLCRQLGLPVLKDDRLTFMPYDQETMLQQLGWHQDEHHRVSLGTRERTALVINRVFQAGYNSVLFCGHASLFRTSRIGAGGAIERPIQEYVVGVDRSLLLMPPAQNANLT